MSIGAYGTSAFSAQRSTDLFRNVKSDLSAAQAQLSTGKAATSYAGLGAGVAPSLTLRAKLSSLDAYAANIQDGDLRLSVMGASLNQIGTVSQGLRTSLAGASGEMTAAKADTVVLARTGLDAIVEALNTDVNGRHLFAGRAADRLPVASADLILNGDTDHAGLVALTSERKAADAGRDGMGRLTLTTTGSSVSLAEEAAGLPFGLKLSGATATGSGVTATLGGTPTAVSIAVGAQPAAGDTLTLTLALPDGTEQVLTLVAGAGPSAGGATGFAIGATTSDTAANIAAALTSAITGATSTVLPSASAMKSAADFFAADAANPPARVAGPPYATATATIPGTSGNTVIWYAGDTSATPRETSPVRIGDERSVGIGAQANEPAFQSILAGFAALAGETYAAADPTSAARYTALASRISGAVAPTTGAQSLSGIAADLSVTKATLKTASDRIGVTKSQATDALSEIEDADPNEAAVKLMAAQTRLQASYQTTATLQKLSLVNYL